MEQEVSVTEAGVGGPVLAQAVPAGADGAGQPAARPAQPAQEQPAPDRAGPVQQPPQGPVVQVAPAERPEITVTPPPPGARVNVAVPAGAVVHLDAPVFHPDVARYVVDGEDLVVVLANGAIVRLDGFFAHPDLPPALTVTGGPLVTATDLLAGLPPGATEVEPAAGGEAPATGPEHGGGASFSPFDPGDIGKGFAPTGPLAPTALGFPAPELPEAEAGAAGGGEPPVLTITGRLEGTLAIVGLDYNPTWTGLRPEFRAGWPVWPASAVGGGGRHPVLDAPREVKVTFHSETAAMHDSFGVLVLGPDGRVGDVRLLFPDVNGSRLDPAMPWLNDGRGPLVEGVSSVDLGVLPAGSTLAFFLVSDGARLNPELATLASAGGHFELRDARTGGAFDANDAGAVPQLVHVAPDGTETVIDTGNRLFVSLDPTPDTPGETPFNADGLAHVAMGWWELTGELMVGFEDVDRAGTIGGGLFRFDGDYDDVVVRVSFGAVEGRVVHYGLDPAVRLDVAVSDPDSTELSGATVRILSGQPGDHLAFAGSLDADGDGVVDGTNIAYAFHGDRLELAGTDTFANYEAVLEAVRLGVDPESGAAGTRTLRITVTDAEGNASDPVDVIVDVRANLVSGTDGNDFLVSPGGLAALDGGAGDDVLFGAGGQDLLYGGPGQDRLEAGAGRDVLIGGPGIDSLNGGPGADLFVFTGLGGGTDVIRDLDLAGGDRVDLSPLFRGTGFPGPSAPDVGDWVRLRPHDWDGDGFDDALLQVDLDGPGSQHVFVGVASLLNTPHTVAIDQLLAPDSGGAIV